MHMLSNQLSLGVWSGETQRESGLNVVVMIIERNVPWSPPIRSHKFFVARWSLVLGVLCQHALDAHADALDGLYGGPASGSEKIETDDAITVDMRVDRDGTRRVAGWTDFDELDFGRFYTDERDMSAWAQPKEDSQFQKLRTDWILRAKGEFESICLVGI